ncbi:processed acidic surface protein [Alteribacter keqinensis]|uniref:processed acidic surface protein n=1 Tax=Alteribacter keqinensis TaxID=2483800 RepID=UPI001605A597|nr:processed acidic surface protein [Alteribacter keqinensis]
MKGLFMSLLAGLFLVVLPSVGSAAPSEKELKSYLQEIEWTKSDLVEYLDFYDLSVEDFEDMEDLRWFLGPVLTPDTWKELLDDLGITEKEALEYLVAYGELEAEESIYDVYKFVFDAEADLYDLSLTPLTDANLAELLKEYELTYDELVALLKENGDSLDNYEYYEDLDGAVWYYLYSDEWDLEFEDIEGLFAEIGLTIEELERLFAHLESLDTDSDAFLEKLEELAWRLMAFEEFDEASELTADQIAELIAIFTELLDLFEMDVTFYLVKGDEKKPVSLQSLMTMTTTNGYDLLIELYNKQGDFLADILLKAELFGWELINGTGNDLKKTHDVIEHQDQTVDKKSESPKKANAEKPAMKTETGAKLPKTATNTASGIAAGLLIMMSGMLFYRRLNVKNG